MLAPSGGEKSWVVMRFVDSKGGALVWVSKGVQINTFGHRLEGGQKDIEVKIIKKLQGEPILRYPSTPEATPGKRPSLLSLSAIAPKERRLEMCKLYSSNKSFGSL